MDGVLLSRGRGRVRPIGAEIVPVVPGAAARGATGLFTLTRKIFHGRTCATTVEKIGEFS